MPGPINENGIAYYQIVRCPECTNAYQVRVPDEPLELYVHRRCKRCSGKLTVTEEDRERFRNRKLRQ